jgi:hypothetical protein
MAMGALKGQAATLQVEMVCLDELVAEDDRYRKLDRLVDWSFVLRWRRRTTPRMSVGRRGVLAPGIVLWLAPGLPGPPARRDHRG